MIWQSRMIRYWWYTEAASRPGFNVWTNLLWQKARKKGRKQAHDLQAIAGSSLGRLLGHDSENVISIVCDILSLRKNCILNLLNCFTCNKNSVTLLNRIIKQNKVFIYKAVTIYVPMLPMQWSWYLSTRSTGYCFRSKRMLLFHIKLLTF